MISIDYLHCTCCGACVQICPKQCISINEQEDGFRYPIVDESLCVNCGRCEDVCPINKSQAKPTIIAYAAVAKNTALLDLASSGGVFGAIATLILKNGGVVYGCAFIQGLKAKHIRVDSFDALPLLFGSKYVQSNTEYSFVSVKKDLANGNWVLFSGTPCQVAGLKYYLGKNYSKLILVDIICHGVPSQAYFDKYTKWLEDNQHGLVSDFQFRSKKNHGWSLAGTYTMVNKSNERKISKLFYFDHYYYYYFLESSIYRECCYSCKYSNLNRVGDFTLGDLWGAESLNLDFDIKNGCSLLLVNTDKAQSILNKLDIFKTKIDLDVAVKYNSQLQYPSNRHPDRDKRIEEYLKFSGNELQKRYLKQYWKTIVKGKIKYIVPISIVQYLNKVRFRVGF